MRYFTIITVISHIRNYTHSEVLREQIDLLSYARNEIRIRFVFRTINGNSNKYEGWYVDDIEIKEG